MMKIDEILNRASKRMGIDRAELKKFFDHGEQRTYEAEEWLFHESTPRRWGGIILDGEVEIVRGVHGSTKHYAVLGSGAMISVDAFLGDLPHTSGAPASPFQVSRRLLSAHIIRSVMVPA